MSIPSPRLPRAILIALLGSASTAGFATNGYFAHGYGIRAEATAGAGIAYAQDSLTIATNPAGLTVVADGLELGLTVFRPDRGASLVQGGVEASFSGNGTNPFFIPSLGYSRRLNDRFTLGVALFGNGGMNTDYEQNPYARFGAQGPAGVDLNQAFLSPAIAWDIGGGHTLGLAVNFAYQRFKARGIGIFAGFSSNPAAVSDQGYDDSFGVGARLGWQWQATDALTLGATWQSKIDGRFDSYAGLFADAGGFDIPSTWGVGLGWRVTDRWHVALDWQRIDYSGVPSVGNSIAVLFQGVPLGGPDGPGFGWHDVSVVKLGTTYQAGDRLVLRAGYSRNEQPVQPAETFFNILAPGVVRDHLTLGASWKFDGRNEISFSYLHAFRHTVNGSGSIPPAFGGGEANVRLSEDSLGISYSRRFHPR